MGLFTIWFAGQNDGLQFSDISASDARAYAMHAQSGKAFAIDEPGGAVTFFCKGNYITHCEWTPTNG